MEVYAFTIEQFAKAHNISRAHFYNLRRIGLGPTEMRVGGRVLISREAAQDWRRERESGAPEKAHGA